MRTVYGCIWLVMVTAISAQICCFAKQTPVRIQKAPAPPATNISTEELSRMAAEQNKMLEKQFPCMAMSKTNAIFARAAGYIVAEMAGHKPDKLPDGLTQADISNAHYHVFIAPQLVQAAKLVPEQKPIGKRVSP
jgi:hypothetical protein